MWLGYQHGDQAVGVESRDYKQLIRLSEILGRNKQRDILEYSVWVLGRTTVWGTSCDGAEFDRN